MGGAPPAPVPRRLLLFFSGWGFGDGAARHLAPPPEGLHASIADPVHHAGPSEQPSEQTGGCVSIPMWENAPVNGKGNGLSNTPGAWDICTCFHYEMRDGIPSLPPAELEKWRAYDGVALVAWSLGVWVAEAVFGDTTALPNLRRAVALNGTPLPVDDRFGIPRAIARGTLEGLASARAGATMEGFLRRALGGPGEMRRAGVAAPNLDSISLPERREELRQLLQAAERAAEWSGSPGEKTDATTGAKSGVLPAPALRWDTAWVCARDAIFPPENQLRYWRERGGTRAETRMETSASGAAVGPRVRELDAPHSPFHRLRHWGELLA